MSGWRRRVVVLLTTPVLCGLAVPGTAPASPASRASDSLRAAFPELAVAPRAPRPPAGTAVDEYVSADIAKLVDSRGRRSLLLSSMPLRSRVGDGSLRPLSLALRNGAPGEVRPENPVTAVRIATDAREGFTVGPDSRRLVTIVPLGLADDAATGTAFAGQMLFAGARASTDLLIRPSATGVQTFEQVNGPAAPQSFAYRLRLATDQTAELANGVVTIRQAGEVIVRSLPPVATDADHKPVPLRISLQDDVVRLAVPHRDGGFRYPLVVDPDWTSSYDYHDQPGLGREGWNKSGQVLGGGDPAGEYYAAFINNEWDGVEEHRNTLGFFIKPLGTPTGRVFPIGVGAQIFFNAPGTTNIRSVTYDHVIRVNDRDRQTLRLGLYGPSFGEASDVFEAEEVSTETITLPSTPFSEDQDTPAKSAVMWMFTSPCNPGTDVNCPPIIDSDTSGTLLKVGSVQLVLTDFDFPSTEITGTLRELQDRWTNATDTRTLIPSAIDEGSGVRDLGLSVEDADGTHALRSIQSPCAPNHDQPGQDNAVCPRDLTFTEPFSLDTDGLLDGRSTFTADAADLAENTATGGGTAAAFSIYLDRARPASTVAGELYDAAGTWTRPRGPGQVTVTGTDVSGGEGRTSGIAHNLLSAVDRHGAAVLSRDADTCTPPGPLAAPCDPGKASSFTVDPRQLPEGPISFTASSRDLAGNDSEPLAWTVRLDRTPPAARATGDLLALTSQHTNSTTPTRVTLQGRDAASGVARVQLVASNSDGEKVLADRDTCESGDVDSADGACPHNPAVEVMIDPGDLPDGPTTFIARAVDQAGIPSVDNQDWDTYVDHTPPDPPGSVSVNQTSNTSVQITWPTVVDQPLGSGNVSYEYLVTAGGQPVGGWRPSANPYAGVGGLPPGVDITVLVRAVDAANNVGRPTRGQASLRQVGVGLGGGGCAVPTGTIGELPWLPLIDGIWAPGGQITATATVGCATAIGITPPAGRHVSVTFPVFKGRTCLERNGGNGWRSFGLCTPFNRPRLKVRSKEVGAFLLFEVSTLVADVGHCRSLLVQGTARFRVRIHLTVRLDVKGATEVGDTSANRTFLTEVQRQHCQTELEGWNRLARTNPRRARIPLLTAPEAILRRSLGDQGSRDTRPINTKGRRTGWEAHHIIPAGAAKAASARISGFRCHVHPNSKVNGIWLRGPSLTSGKDGYDDLPDDQRRRVLHSRTFTTNYYERINRLMATARRGQFGCDAGTSQQLLEDVDHQLANGEENIHDTSGSP